MTSSGRYHLLLGSGGRSAQHGWWGCEATAWDKFRSWVSEYGSMPGAQLIVTDADNGDVLAAWPHPR
ncbi:hypothetical protein AB0F03_37095 [Streptomyces sp. NPDC028722]|uniref:hypothetical protein n=1 Tax=unclassified Streptomyces TaxID=2593676 RepID=UPI0033E5419E